MRHYYREETTTHRSPLGMLLARVRTDLELEIEHVSWDTCIPVQQLALLEQGAFTRIPEEVYRLNILKTYSTYLGLSWDMVRDYYEEERTRALHGEEVSITALGSAIPAAHFWDATRILKYAGLGVVVCGAVAYLSWLGYYAVKPPELVVVSPAPNLVSDREAVMVEGYTKGASSLMINGIAVAHDSEGRFRQEVTLSPGMNTLTVSAAKRYGHTAVVTRQVMWDSSMTGVVTQSGVRVTN